MRRGPLYLGEGNVAAWHWSWSVTWRWVLRITRHDPRVRMGSFWLRSIKGINTPWVDLCLHVQGNMPRAAMGNHNEG